MISDFTLKNENNKKQSNDSFKGSGGHLIVFYIKKPALESLDKDNKYQLHYLFLYDKLLYDLVINTVSDDTFIRRKLTWE